MRTAEDQDNAARGTRCGANRRLMQVARQVFAAIGNEFFQSLTKQLVQTLDADCVYIGEFVGGSVERVRPLAGCMDRERMDEVTFPLAGTPESQVALGHHASIQRDCWKLGVRNDANAD